MCQIIEIDYLIVKADYFFYYLLALKGKQLFEITVKGEILFLLYLLLFVVILILKGDKKYICFKTPHFLHLNIHIENQIYSDILLFCLHHFE